MTTTATAPTAIDVVLAPALEAYSAALAAHGIDYKATEEHAAPTCKCGRSFRKSQGLGLHRGAEERKASKAYDAEAKVALDRLAGMTSAERAELVDAHLAATTTAPVVTVTPEAEAELDRIAAELQTRRYAGKCYGACTAGAAHIDGAPACPAANEDEAPRFRVVGPDSLGQVDVYDRLAAGSNAAQLVALAGLNGADRLELAEALLAL